MPINTDDYVRPYGPNAPWNIPVDGLPIHDDSEELATKLWNDTGTDRADRNFNINNTSYTYPVYEVTEDTPTMTVESRNGWGNLDGEEIPFDPSWEPAPGSDAQIIILDPATGREWNLWQAEVNGDTVTVSNGNLVEGMGGSDSYFDREVGFGPSRGVGIQYLAMLVRPEEVALGEIQHALSLPIQNTSGAEFAAPGTKIEHPGVRMDGIPEGTRFSLDVTYDEIDEHIASLPDEVPDVTKESLRTIMVAMKDYGWFVTDTSGGTHFQLESTTSAQEEWEALGMIDFEVGGKVYPRDALDGLITEDRLITYAPSDEYDYDAIEAAREGDPAEEDVVFLPDPDEYGDDVDPDTPVGGEGDGGGSSDDMADGDAGSADEDSGAESDGAPSEGDSGADDDGDMGSDCPDDEDDGDDIDTDAPIVETPVAEMPDDGDADAGDEGSAGEDDSEDDAGDGEGTADEAAADDGDDDTGDDDSSGDDASGDAAGGETGEDDEEEQTVEEELEGLLAQIREFFARVFGWGSDDDNAQTETAEASAELYDDTVVFLTDILSDTGATEDDSMGAREDDEDEEQDMAVMF
ncbi:MAG: hypothetical protein AAF771_13780 [Pseudomonadota bacterium]